MKINPITLLVGLFCLPVLVQGCGDDEENIDTDPSSDGDADSDTDSDVDSDSDSDVTPNYDCVDDIAWYTGNAQGESAVVKQLQPNAFGLYDILGNTIEWTSDCYHDTYSGAPDQGNVIWDETNCEYRVLRGGCYGAPASGLRVSKREAAKPTAYGSCMPGVRCAADSIPTSSYTLQYVNWVQIPAGSFTMGCTDDGGYECLANEFPIHTVSVPSFYMTDSEITGIDFVNVTDLSPNVNGEQQAAHKIYYDDAKLFCERIGARLPTEAEWEYAARGGTTGAYYCQ